VIVVGVAEEERRIQEELDAKLAAEEAERQRIAEEKRRAEEEKRRQEELARLVQERVSYHFESCDLTDFIYSPNSTTDPNPWSKTVSMLPSTECKIWTRSTWLATPCPRSKTRRTSRLL